MKTFVSGIIGAIVAGLVLFFAQTWWTESALDSKQRISFDEVAGVTLSADELRNLAEAAGSWKAEVHIFKAQNLGSEDISNRSFSVADGGIKGFGSISDPNSNPKNAAISYDGKVLTVNYRILPSNSEHVFWVATSQGSYLQNLASDSPGVHVVTSTEKAMAEYPPFPWGWLAAVASVAIAFTLGVAAGMSSQSKQLSKVVNTNTSPNPSQPAP